MEYPQRIQRAIDHIEQHLSDVLPVEEIAAQAYLSVAHLYRIFPILAGCTVGQYVRRRRLSCAADMLARTRRRVLDVALEYRFESQESFIRAFKALFGITPGDYRKLKPIITIYKKMQLNLSQRKEPLPMQPDIIKKKFLLAGVQTEMDLSVDFTQRITALRNALRQSLPDIPEKVEPVRMVGFWFPDPDNTLSETYSKCFYFAGVEVRSADGVPENLAVKDLPESLFARFREQTRGTMNRYGYTQWLPTSGYILNMDLAGDFEIFDDMVHDAVDDPCDILLPIRTPEGNA